MLDPVGEKHLLDLAHDRDFVAEQKVPHDLLRDGRGSDRALPFLIAPDIRHRGAEDRDRVHPLMRIEIAILGGEESVDQHRRNIADGHRHSVLALELDHEAAVRGVDLRTGRRHIARQLLVARQFATEIDQTDPSNPGSSDRGDYDEDEGDSGERAQSPHHCCTAVTRPNNAAPPRIIVVSIIGDPSAMSPSQLIPASRHHMNGGRAESSPER